jgi:hypothetical protein
VPDIRHLIPIDASPERIRPLISSGAGFTKWWAEDLTENSTSTIAELGFFNRSTLYRLEILPCESPKEIHWLCTSGKEWLDTKLIFSLKPNNAQTVVHFAHAGWETETDYFLACNTTWGELMYRLKAAAEGKSHTPLFLKSGFSF